MNGAAVGLGSEEWYLACQEALDLLRFVRDHDKNEEEEAAVKLSRSILGQPQDHIVENVSPKFAEDFLRGVVVLLDKAENLERACASLDRFGKTNHGKRILERSLTPSFVTQALDTPSVEVKTLICRQVKRVVGGGQKEEKDEAAAAMMTKSTEEKLELLKCVASCLRDEELGVNQVASECFESAAYSLSDDSQALDFIVRTLRGLVPDLSSEESVRIVHTLINVSKASDLSFSCFVGSGVMDVIVNALRSSSDQLTKICLVEMFLFMVADELDSGVTNTRGVKTSKLAVHFAKATGEALMEIILSREDIPVMLRGQSMQLLASLQSLCCEEDPAFQIDSKLMEVMLANVKGRDTELTRSTLNATTGFLVSRNGVLTFLQNGLAASLVSFAFERGTDESVQEDALHILGRFVSAATDRESAIKPIIFSTLSEYGSSLPDALEHILNKPEDKLREGCYYCISAIAKTEWGVMEICTKKSLIERLSDAQSEREQTMANCRFKCVCEVNKTANSLVSSSKNQTDKLGVVVLETISPLLSILQKSVEAGPFGDEAAMHIDFDAA
mmetsp:Transcript_6191/g.11335  ORF Transcript_6191/g.11335 Transcript_6191/m.11335 type:complete len:560 (+) Transcript_6191:44-1723(+)